VFEDKVLSRTHATKRKEAKEERRKLHNEGLHHVCSSPDIIVRWAEHVVRFDELGLCTRTFSRKT
jgi:hypothetical protein